MFESTVDYCNEIDSLIDHLKYQREIAGFLKVIMKSNDSSSQIVVDIRQYLTSIESSVFINSKRFNYSNSIISLYGYLESFLEAVVEEFISKLNATNVPYEKLPNAVKKFHLNGSIDLLNKVKKSRNLSKDKQNSDIKQIVKNMNSCVNGVGEYNLNEKAYSLHTANFRYDTIHNLFCKIGVQGLPRKTLDNEEFQKVLINKYTDDPGLDMKVLVSLLTSEFDNLAQRRNEISHGSFDGDLESIDFVVERALLLKCFGKAANNILEDYYHDFVFSSMSKLNLGKAGRIFSSAKVFGFQKDDKTDFDGDYVISTGQMILAHNCDSKTPLKYGRIESIVVGGEKLHSVTIPSQSDFALKVDFELSSHDSKRDVYIVTLL